MAKKGKDSDRENRGRGKPDKKDGGHRQSTPGRSNGNRGRGGRNG